MPVNVPTLANLGIQPITPYSADGRSLDAVQYQAVGASVTTANLTKGTAGQIGDYLARVVITPATTGAGTVAIKDGSQTAITIYAGMAGTNNLMPTNVELGIRSTSGGWQINTGANVSIIAVGNFT